MIRREPGLGPGAGICPPSSPHAEQASPGGAERATLGVWGAGALLPLPAEAQTQAKRASSLEAQEPSWSHCRGWGSEGCPGTVLECRESQ